MCLFAAAERLETFRRSFLCVIAAKNENSYNILDFCI